MSEYDLKQVKADLDTIRTVAGISEGPVRHDLLGNLVIAAAGFVTAGWAMLAHGLWQMCGLVAVLLPVGYLIGLRVRHRKQSGGSPQVRQDFSAGGSVLAVGGAVVGCPLWGPRGGGSSGA